MVLGTIAAGEGFGEASLLDHRATHTKTVACASTGGCEIVEIAGGDFLRLIEKSRCVRESFQKLHSRRAKLTKEALANSSQPPAAA